MSGLEGAAAAVTVLTLCGRIVKLATTFEDRYIAYERVKSKRLKLERVNRHLNTDLEKLREVKGPSPALSDYQDCSECFRKRLVHVEEELRRRWRLHRLIGWVKPVTPLAKSALYLFDDFTAQLEDIQRRVTKDLVVKDAMVPFNPYEDLQEARFKFDSNTRKWVFDRIDDWYETGCKEDKSWSNVFLVVGPAGVGKTVISGVVCERGGCFPQPEVEEPEVEAEPEVQPEVGKSSSPEKTPPKNAGICVRACVAIRSQSPLARDPLRILKVIAYQLGCANGSEDEDWQEFFHNRLLSFAKKSANQHESVIVTVIDGLDECQDQRFGRWLVRAWASYMPRCFALFATSRYDYFVGEGTIRPPTTLLPSKSTFKIDFEDAGDAALHNDDMQTAVRNILKQQGEFLTFTDIEELEPAVQLFMRLSEDRFMYFDSLEAQLSEVATQHRVNVCDKKAKVSAREIETRYADHFPVGIKKSVEDELKRLARLLKTIPELYEVGCEEFPQNDNAPNAVQRETNRRRQRYILEFVVGPMLACPTPLPLDMLVAVCLCDKLRTDSTRSFESTVVKYLTRSALVNVYKGGIGLRHDLIKTVLRSTQFQIDETRGHQLLASYCINSWNESRDQYAAQYLTYHIAMSARDGNQKALKRLLQKASDTCYSDRKFFEKLDIPQQEVLAELSQIGWSLSRSFDKTWKSLDSSKYVRTAVLFVITRRRHWLVDDIELVLLSLKELFAESNVETNRCKRVQVDTYITKEVASVLADLHQADESLKWYNTAEKNIDECGKALRSSLYRGMAELHLVFGQFDSAKECMKKCSDGLDTVPHAELEVKILLGSEGVAGEDTIQRLRDALKMCQNDASTNPLQIMKCRTLLAGCLGTQGKYSEAEQELRMAQSEYPKPDSSEYAENLYHLAEFLEKQDRFDESMDSIKSALKICRRHYGEAHGSVADCRSKIASVLSRSGRHEEAVKLQRETNDLLLQIYSDAENPEVIFGEDRLAAYLKAQGKLDEAEEILRKVLLVVEKTFGGEHPRVAMSLETLAQLMHDQGKLDDAERLCRRTLEISKATLSSGHPNIAAGLINLGAVLKDKGKLNEARELYREALAMERRHFGNNHPEVATTLSKLGTVLNSMGDHDGAEEVLEEAMRIRKTACGDQHLLYASSLQSLAKVRSQQHRYEVSNGLFEEALAIKLTTFGPAHLDVADSYWEWAKSLKSQGASHEARSKWSAACNAYQESLGMEHAQYKSCLEWWRD